MTQEINKATRRKISNSDSKITEPVDGAVTILEQEPDDLPPSDRGWLAWRFSLVAFVIDGLVWGPPLCYGVFLPFKPYSELNPALAASIGTSCLSLLFVTGVVLSPLALKNRKFCILSPWIGAALCFAGLFAASYTDKAGLLIMTQGVLYGIGGSMIYTPNLIYLSEWWILKRGLMGGLTFSGSAVLGLVWGPVMEYILEKHPAPIALRYYSFVWLSVMLMFLPFMSGRLQGSSRTSSGSTNMEYFKSPLFWFLILVNCIQSLAFYIPSIYMPSFTKSMGTSSALPLGLYSAASIPSQILSGMASDYVDCSWILLMSCLTSSVNVFFMWGFCKNFSMFCAFCTIYGLSAPCYTSLWHRFAMIIAPNDPRPASVISFFLASRGVVNLITGPFCGLLIQTSHPSTKDYRRVINACGTLLLVSSLGVGMRLLRASSPKEELAMVQPTTMSSKQKNDKAESKI